MATATGQLHWEVAATPAEMSRLRRELSSAARLVMAEDAAVDLTLATSEVLGNVVRHAYHGDAGRCRLSFGWDKRGVVVVVEDDGDGFFPELSVHKGDWLQSDAESGRGLPLARMAVDELRCVNGQSGGARVELVVNLGPVRENNAAAGT